MTSKIVVNNIEADAGINTVTISGDVTATNVTGTHHGSAANLTSIPAANLTGTLPAISAANLTSLPAANLTGTLPAISAANLTSIPAGNLTGIITAARLGGGSASSSTFLRGDGTFAAAGGGDLLQIVQASSTTYYDTTSTSYQTTNLSVDITTGSVASKIYIVANPFIGARGSNGQDAYMRVQLLRGSTELRKMFSGGWMGNLSSISNWQHYATVTMPYIDTGVSTGTTYTYSVKYAKHSSTTQAQFNPHSGSINGGSWITAMEIKV